MQVVILAGGLGTRIRAVSEDLPKSLLPVAGKPFVDHQLDLLEVAGLTDILLCVGHFGDKIENHLGDGSQRGFRIEYSWEDPTSLLGTGGAVLNARELLQDEFLLMYGDSYLPTDYRAVVGAFEDRSEKAMMCVYHNEGKWDPSNVRIADDRVVFYAKNADPSEVKYIDYGLSAYRKSVIEDYADSALPLDMATIQGELVDRGELGAYEVSERFYEIGKPEGLQELEDLLSRSS